MPSSGNLIQTIEGSTAVLTLNRPERRNALSLDLMLELITCLEEIDRKRRDPRSHNRVHAAPFSVQGTICRK